MTRGVFRDLTGRRFGRLVVLSRGPSDRSGATWHCHCDCGTDKLAKAKFLMAGSARSCGCLIRELNRERCRAPEVAAKLAESMRQSWEDGRRRAAYEATFGARPVAERRTAQAEAAADLAAALGMTVRR